jgi:hypothetical protein
MIPDPNYSSSMKQWQNQIAKTDPNYLFLNLRRDSSDGFSVETADIRVVVTSGRNFKGRVKIVKSGNVYYFLQITSDSDYRQQLSPEVLKIENSFEVISK